MIAVVIAVVATGLAALLSMSDGALLATHTSPEHAWDSDAERNRREREHRALAMGRVILYLAAGAAIGQVFELGVYSVGMRTLLQVAVALVVAAVTESAARAMGQSSAQSLDSVVGPITTVATIALLPAVALGAKLERLLHFVLPPHPELDESREATAEQFREVVASEAEVTPQEEELIHGVFSLGETAVHEVMVPRVDIVGIDSTTPWSEVVDRFRSSEHARLPVYEETLDNIVGILYAKDLLPDVVSEHEEPEDWHRLIRPPVIIPTSKLIDQQLREFQATRTHIAIVADEYGGTAGLVTIEDILEEIVGEIRDEYDVEEAEIEQDGDDRFWVLGRVSIDELSERLGADMSHDEVSTVGGLVYELFGRVPKNGDAITYGNFRIVVERVRRRRIERVYFERMEPVEVAEGEE
jgi:CBS domain containing-hemolysin-like protein